jgi:hypothetical protein
MSVYKVIIIILAGCSIASSSLADIFEWTDENGVRHYSNYAPPAGSKVLMKTKEEPYDEAADRARMEADRQLILEITRLEIEQRKAELELREAEAERRLAEADRIVEETLRETERYREEAEADSTIIYGGWGAYWCPDNRLRCNDTLYDRWYYRKHFNRGNDTLYDRWYNRKHFNRGYRDRRYHLSPYQQYLYVKKHYGSKKRPYGFKRSGQIRKRLKGHYSTSRLKTYRNRKYGAAGIERAGGRYNGRRSFSRGHSGFSIHR